MKIKKILLLVLVSVFAFVMIGCGKEKPTDNPTPEDPTPTEEPVKQTFTVIFNVDGVRFATAKVKDGEKVTSEIATPSKEGYSFLGWYEGETKVDLATYIVTKDVTFEAKFVKDEIDNSLDVNAKKEAGKTYTLVIGWWEVKNPDDPDKKTSYLTDEVVQKFYANVNLYLKVKGLTEDEIKNVQFRNYSTATVAEMGALVNADGDVDIMIGVGNNINSTAGVSLYEGSNDNKFATTMGTTPTSRYVALTSVATELGVNVYDWLTTEIGKSAFTTVLKESDITVAPPRTSEANLDVVVYTDDTNTTTIHFETKDQELTLPLVTLYEGFEFKGFATAVGGNVVLSKANGAALKYSDVKDLPLTDGKVILYPVYEAIIISAEDLVVYVQLNKGLTENEAYLLESRFKATLAEEKNIDFVLIEGDAAGFTSALNDATTCVDVIIGGNNPLKNFAAHESGALANAGSKHFLDTSRKVLINANAQHLDLAKALYDFVVADAPSYELHITFWLNNNTWITPDELAALKTNGLNYLQTAFNIAEGSTLLDVYNVTVTTFDATKTKVAELAAETNEQRDGKGTDLIVGCGANVTTTGGFTTASVKDIPTTMVAAGRKVALITDNFLAKLLFDGLFQ